MKLTSWDHPEQITTDESAPLFYSKRAIFAFSVLFAPIFGGVLLAQNIHYFKKWKGIYLLISFCLLYTIFVIIIVNHLSRPSTSVTYILNALGSVVLIYYFWPAYVGHELRYRKKKIWRALIISLLITLPLLLAILYQL